MFNQLRGYLATFLLAAGLALPIAASWATPAAAPQAGSPAVPGAVTVPSSTRPSTPAASVPASGLAGAAILTPPTVNVVFLPDSLTEIVVALESTGDPGRFEANTSILLRNMEMKTVKVSNFRATLRNEAGRWLEAEVAFKPESIDLAPNKVTKVSLKAELTGPHEAFGAKPTRPSLNLVGYLVATAQLAVEPAAPPNVAAQTKVSQRPARAPRRAPKKVRAQIEQQEEPPPSPPRTALLLRPMRLTPPVPSPLAPLPVVLGLALGLMTVAMSYFSLGNKRKRLGAEMGLPVWSGGSWATNLTALAAVLAALFNNLIPIQTQLLQRAEYNGLLVLFTVLVTLAPALYVAIKTSSTVEPPGDRGYVGMFLVVTVIALWAIFGEAVLLVMLLDETNLAQITPAFVTRTFQVVICVVFLLLLIYSWRTIRSNTSEPDDAKLRESTVSSGVRETTQPSVEQPPEATSPAVPQPARTPLPQWQVL